MNYKNMVVGALVSVGVIIAIKKFGPRVIAKEL